MKKFLPVLLAILLLACSACTSGSPAAGQENIEGSVEELLGKVTQDAADPEISLMTTQAADENFEWYFFIQPIDGSEGWVSEPMIGSIPHCIGLLRVPASQDPEEVRTEIEENINPRKWVCVEAEKTAVLRRGDLILVAMSDTATVDKAVANFQAL